MRVSLATKEMLTDVRTSVIIETLTLTLRGLSPRAKYIDRATAAGRRS